MKRGYVHPSLVATWLPTLRQVSNDRNWLTTPPETWARDDVIILPEAEAQHADAELPGKRFYVSSPVNGPQLTEIIDTLQPKTEELGEAVLEQGWRALVEDLDSLEDVDRMARFSLALWQKKRRESDRRWLELAELAWSFEFRRVNTPDGETPLYVAMGFQSWYEFSNDFLEIAAPVSSSLKWTWELYHVRLGWSIQEMVRIGRSKLALANGKVRALMDEPEQAADGKLEEILASLESDSFAVLNDRLRADREGGHTVSFRHEDGIEDPGLVRKWLKEKVQPDVLHAQVFYDRAPLTGEDSGFVIILNPDIGADEAALIKAKLGRMLHWQAKEK